MQIANARNRLRLKQPQQLHHLLMGSEGNFCAEGNQQRLIASRLESRAFARRCIHARESIPHVASLACRAALPGPAADPLESAPLFFFVVKSEVAKAQAQPAS